MELKPQQQEIFNKVVADFHNKVKRIIIKGSAGTGKTFLVAHLIKHFVQILPKYRPIYVTAPTNKALAVLTNKVEVGDAKNIIFKTVHSSLALKMFTDNKTQETKFVPTWRDKRDPFGFDRASICFVDEASMLNTELIKMLEEMFFCIIFIGDYKQLNPVGEEISPIWKKEQEPNYSTYELTEIVRQGAGNPIIELSQNLIYAQSRINKLTEDKKGYLFDNNIDYILNRLAEVNGTDELKYVTWTNKTVDAINEQVRKRLYGEFPNKVELGETLIMDEPFGEHYTNKEIKVEKLVVIDDFASGMPHGLSKFDGSCEPLNKLDDIMLKFYLVNDEIKILHEESELDYFDAIQTIKNGVNKLAWEYRGLIFFQSQFAKIKYNHAISVHKSQGSTFKSAILNIGEMMKNRDKAERDRLLYTAITRASDLLILTNLK